MNLLFLYQYCSMQTNREMDVYLCIAFSQYTYIVFVAKQSFEPVVSKTVCPSASESERRQAAATVADLFNWTFSVTVTERHLKKTCFFFLQNKLPALPSVKHEGIKMKERRRAHLPTLTVVPPLLFFFFSSAPLRPLSSSRRLFLLPPELRTGDAFICLIIYRLICTCSSISSPQLACIAELSKCTNN